MNAHDPLAAKAKGTTVSVHEAKTHLSRLLARVETGEEITVARGKTPIARIVPLGAEYPKPREPGRLACQVPPGHGGILSHGFWEPLTDEEMRLTYKPDLGI